MRASLLIALALTCSACCCPGALVPRDVAAGGTESRPTDPELMRESRRIERALDEQRVTWAFEESMERFVRRLRERHGVKAALANDLILGDGWKTVVRADVEDVRLGEAVRQTLASRGLSFVVRDGLLVIRRR